MVKVNNPIIEDLTSISMVTSPKIHRRRAESKIGCCLIFCTTMIQKNQSQENYGVKISYDIHAYQIHFSYMMISLENEISSKDVSISHSFRDHRFSYLVH